MDKQSKAEKLAGIFGTTQKTEESIGRFKLKVFLSGVAFDNGVTIVFKDGSIADFTNRDSLNETQFKAIKGK